MPYNNQMRISDSVMQQLKDLSGDSNNNPHRILAAMVNAIKNYDEGEGEEHNIIPKTLETKWYRN